MDNLLRCQREHSREKERGEREHIPRGIPVPEKNEEENHRSERNSERSGRRLPAPLEENTRGEREAGAERGTCERRLPFCDSHAVNLPAGSGIQERGMSSDCMWR